MDRGQRVQTRQTVISDLGRRVGGELDEFGYEVVEEVDTLDSHVEFRRTILGDLFERVEDGLISALTRQGD